MYIRISNILEGVERKMRTLFLDIASGVLFFAVLLITANIFTATAVGIVTGLATLGWTRAGGRRIDPMQWIALALVLVMGGATILTHDPRFVMFKPTLLQFCIGCAMLRPGWMIRYLPASSVKGVPLRPVIIIGYVYAAALFGMAAANLLFATRTDPKTWAAYNAVGPAMIFSLLGGSSYLIVRGIAVKAARSQSNAAR